MGVRATRAQRERCFGLLRSAGDVWACLLEVNWWRRQRQDVPLAGYQELCRQLTAAGPGTFGELDRTGARSMLRRYSDAWFSSAKRRKAGRHRRRIQPTQHEAATMVIDWAIAHQVGTPTVGDPRDVLDHDSGPQHNLRLRQWQIGRTIQILQDKAQFAGIQLHLVDERGTSSTCPACLRRVPKPKGRILSCPHCGYSGHRDLCGPPPHRLVGSRSTASAARIHNTNPPGKR